MCFGGFDCDDGNKGIIICVQGSVSGQKHNGKIRQTTETEGPMYAEQ